MDDVDRHEMQVLCDQFRQLMQREIDPPQFDKEVRERVGKLIGRAARQGRSDFAALRG